MFLKAMEISVSILRKRWALRWKSAILMIGHYFCQLVPQREGPTLSLHHEPTLPHHRSQKLQVYQADSPGAVTLLLSQMGSWNPIIHQRGEDPMSIGCQAHFPSSLSTPSLSISPSCICWYEVSSFLLPSTSYPFLSSSTFFWVANTRGQHNLTYLSVLCFHQQREEFERTYKNYEVFGNYFEICNKLVQQNGSLKGITCQGILFLLVNNLLQNCLNAY